MDLKTNTSQKRVPLTLQDTSHQPAGFRCIHLINNFNNFIVRAGFRILQVPDTPKEFVGQYLLFAYLDEFVKIVHATMRLEVPTGRGRGRYYYLTQQTAIHHRNKSMAKRTTLSGRKAPARRIPEVRRGNGRLLYRLRSSRKPQAAIRNRYLGWTDHSELCYSCCAKTPFRGSV